MGAVSAVQQPRLKMRWQDRDIGREMIVAPICEQIARKNGCINYGIAVKYVS
jgi:hypothetical protein